MDTIELNLPRVPVSVARARAGMRPLLEPLGDRYQDVVLLVSELVTNAIRHGSGTTVSLTAQLRACVLRVEVIDGGEGFAPPQREPDPSSPNGRGLRIVESVCDAWGVYEGNSTHVWFELDLDR